MLYRDFLKKKYSARKQSRLPPEYQEVEWIATDGSAYIDTGIIPDINKAYDFYAEWYVDERGDQVFLGARIDNGNTRFFPFAVAISTTLKLNIGFTVYFYGKTIETRTKLKCNSHLEQGNQIWSEVNQTTPSSENVSFPESYVFTKSLYLFRTNYSSPSACRSGARVYQLKAFEDGKLISNLIPCYRKSNDEIGMYDTISRTFLTNQGTGIFTKGPNI